MRIVGGKFKGKALKTPKSDQVRPTSDRVRETIYNILAHNNDLFANDASVDGSNVIDLFAGTGALGLEALSRGAAFALFVDSSLEGRSLIRENIMVCGVAARARLFKRDATKLGARGKMGPFSLAFLDPPYGKGLGEKALAALVDGAWLEEGALIVWEEAGRADTEAPHGFSALDTRQIGETQITFFRYTQLS
ncbi:MAG: 16S rRNA (guanine(966)-N(2))-methyltransferase RsmD [Pseudomonadota bacterium]